MIFFSKSFAVCVCGAFFYGIIHLIMNIVYYFHSNNNLVIYKDWKLLTKVGLTKTYAKFWTSLLAMVLYHFFIHRKIHIIIKKEKDVSWSQNVCKNL